jgi:phosphopantetheinyl transferase
MGRRERENEMKEGRETKRKEEEIEKRKRCKQRNKRKYFFSIWTLK